MSTVHFEPTISAAPATEQVGASWTGSIVRRGHDPIVGPALVDGLARRVERRRDRALDASAELVLGDACDRVEDLVPRSGFVEARIGENVAVEATDAVGVPRAGHGSSSCLRSEARLRQRAPARACSSANDGRPALPPTGCSEVVEERLDRVP